MAEITEEPKQNPIESPSSPDSAAPDPNDAKAPKDRACPFCGQAFTSSSLGRHLDLYIKPKNPKAPDGVHDVNEIKKIRGGITRRQPRTSLKIGSRRDAQSRDSSVHATSVKRRRTDLEAKANEDSPMVSPRDQNDGRVRTWLNVANWQATGVINDLPARTPSRANERPASAQAQRMSEMRRDAQGKHIERPDSTAEDMWKLTEAAEVGRAAEMALREVLGSLEAAKRSAHPGKLFEDFDFCALTFPGMCLAMLPPPPTLFSSTPFSAAHTWPLIPPGEMQKAALFRVLNERIVAVRNGVKDNLSDTTIFGYHVHLDGAWEHWQTLSEEEKTSAWQLELCRAFVHEREAKQRLTTELEFAEQRIRHLEAEFDRMSRCQLPREYLLHPPNTAPISPTIAREMKSSHLGADLARYDYDADALLSKWKAEVKAVSRPPKSALFPPPPQAPPREAPQHNGQAHKQMRRDVILNGSVFQVNGPSPRDADGRIDTYHPTPEPSKGRGEILGPIEDSDVEMNRPDMDTGDDAYLADGYAGPGALAQSRRARHFARYPHVYDDTSNANGERQLTTSAGTGPKLYREQLT